MRKSKQDKSISSIVVKSIRSSIIISVSVICAITYVILCLSIVSITKKTTAIEAKSAAERVSSAVRYYETVTESMGIIPLLSDPEVPVAEKKNTLDQMCAKYNTRVCKIINADGYSDMDANYRGDRSYFTTAMSGETCISDLLVSRADGVLSVTVAAPLWKDGVYQGEVAGVVFSSIDTTILDQVVRDFSVSEHSHSYIIGSAGGAIAASDGGTLFQGKDKHVELVRERIRRGENGIYSCMQGWTRVYYAYYQIEGVPGWCFLLQIPLSDNLADFNIGIVVLTLVTVVLVSVMSIRAKSIGDQAAAPVKILAEKLSLVAHGEYAAEKLNGMEDTSETRQISEATGKLMGRLDAEMNAIEEVKVNISLTDLINVEILQNIQNFFSETVNMAALITDADGVAVTKGSHFTDFCTKFTRKSEVGRRNCENCDRSGALKTIEKDEPVLYTCHAGLVDFAAPIMLQGRLIGSFVGGQVRTEDVNEDKFREIAIKYGIPASDYIQAARKTPVFSEQQIKEVSGFLKVIARILSQIAEENYVNSLQSKKISMAARHNMTTIVNMNGKMANMLRIWIPEAREAYASGSKKKMRIVLDQLIAVGSESLSVIDETVEYAKMTDLNASLKEEVYSPHEIVYRLENDVRDYMPEGVELKIHINPGVPHKLFGDKSRISQMISRLVLNSIEFVERGNITIDMSCVKKLYSTMLEIKVSDTGNGMTPSQIEEVKQCLAGQRYNSAKMNKAQEMKFGTLSRLCSQMSGTIEFNSSRGEGTEFTVAIPQLEVNGGDK